MKTWTEELSRQKTRPSVFSFCHYWVPWAMIKSCTQWYLACSGPEIFCLKNLNIRSWVENECCCRQAADMNIFHYIYYISFIYMSDRSYIVNANIDLAILKSSDLMASGTSLDVPWADTKLQHCQHTVSVWRPRGHSHWQISCFGKEKQHTSKRACQEVGGHQPAVPEAAQEAVPVVGQRVILNLTMQC